MKYIRRRQIKLLRKKRSESCSFKMLISSTASLCVTTLFALYHGFLGLALSSIWHGGICVFYLCFIASVESRSGFHPDAAKYIDNGQLKSR